MTHAFPKIRHFLLEVFLVITTLLIYGIPFLFMVLNAMKDRRSAGLMRLSWPEEIHLWENLVRVITERNFLVLTSFRNSITITVGTLLILTVVCSMAGYVLQRRNNRFVTIVSYVFLTGLMLPPSILPTIWVLNLLGLFRSLTGMILVQVVLRTPFTIMLYRSFVAAIPQQLEEAAIIDGANSHNIFLRVIFPLLKPVTVTSIILNSVVVFNDFVHPLYFLPGARNATVQLTLYSFIGQYSSSWNLLFTNALFITLPLLVLFIIFNRHIVEGITAGAIKG